MKLLFILSILTISVSSTFAQNLRYTYHDFSGTKVKEKFYVNSKEQKHGSYTAYASNGKIIAEATFKNGSPDGKQERFIDMKLNNECSKLPYSIRYYDDGERVGTWKEYGCKGGERILIKLEKYENDEKIYFEHYSDDGSKKIAAGYNYNGKQEKWYPDGQLANVVHLKEGVFEGPFKQYYTNGQIGVDGVKKNGKWFGEKNEWYANGNKKSIENFTDGDDYGEIYLGKQQYFDSLGNKVKEYVYSELKNSKQKVTIKEFYKSGKLKSEYEMIKVGRKNPSAYYEPNYVDYHENGEIAEKGQLNKEGYKNGEVLRFDSDGSKIGEYEYNNGDRIGEWTIYYDSDWNEVPSKNSASYIRKLTFNHKGRPVEDQLVKDFYKNGKPQFQGYLYDVNPDIKSGYSEFYYKTGNIKKKGQFKAFKLGDELYDRPFGKFISYHKNGEVSEVGEYKLFKLPNGEVVSFKVGDWLYYGEDGMVDSAEVYEEKHEKTVMVSTLFSEDAKKLAKYNTLVLEGDELYTERRYSEAKLKYQEAKKVFPQRKEIDVYITNAKKEHANLINNTKELTDSVHTSISNLYTGSSELSGFVGKDIKKVEKKHLFEGFEKVLEQYKSQTSEDMSSTEAINIMKNLRKLAEVMTELRQKETKDLEKSIRKADNVQEIINFLKIEENED